MLYGTLDKYTGSIYTLELKEDAKPYHAKPLTIPNIHETILKKEVDRLIKMEVLKKIHSLPSAAITFIIPKNNSTVRLISDFRELNKTIKTKNFSYS